jgi:hypothetical protein
MDKIEMSGKDLRRLNEMGRIERKETTITEAALRLGLSRRQTGRIYRRYSAEGAAGIPHKGIGRTSPNARDETFREKAVERYKLRYPDFGPTLAAEKLAKEGFELDHETLRRWLIDEDLWKVRRSRKYRRRRGRKERFGELLQIDGSHHKWFEDRGGKCCLMNLVDDATGITMSFMAEEETTEAALTVLLYWVRKYGIPEAIYCDWKSVYLTKREPTDEELLAGKLALTAFGKVCAKLGIRLIGASSPQAKGRVERNHAVYQDRFVKELRLLNVSTIEGANEALRNGFIDELNRKFSVEPESDEDAHVPVGGINLDEVFAWEETRTLSSDWVIRYENRFFQVLKANRILPRPGSKIVVSEKLDGVIRLIYNNEPLLYKEIGLSSTESLVG